MKPLTKSVHQEAIIKAKAIVQASGGRIVDFTIYYAGDDKAVLEAIIFLVNRWDYEYHINYKPSSVLQFWRLPLGELTLWCVMICSIVFLLCHLIFN